MAQAKKIFDGEKPAVIHEAPENPTAQLGSAGFLRLLRSPDGSLRPRPRRPTALRLDNARQCRGMICTETDRSGQRPGLFRPAQHEISRSLEVRGENLRIEVRAPILRQIAADSPT
ncbi:hypothetical protein J2Y63_005547 [Shinella sp. BE166]|uniref:hypothetical protein n=1 Tax=Shinella sp. BE166 TaxID=3373918 RepID=UPI003EBCFEE0